MYLGFFAPRAAASASTSHTGGHSEPGEDKINSTPLRSIAFSIACPPCMWNLLLRAWRAVQRSRVQGCFTDTHHEDTKITKFGVLIFRNLRVLRVFVVNQSFQRGSLFLISAKKPVASRFCTGPCMST